MVAVTATVGINDVSYVQSNNEGLVAVALGNPPQYGFACSDDGSSWDERTTS